MKSLGACLFLSVLLCVWGAVAQEGPAVSPTNLPTVEALQDLVSQLDQSTAFLASSFMTSADSIAGMPGRRSAGGTGRRAI